MFDEYYKDTCAIRKSDMIAFLQENSVYSLKDGIGECEATVQIYVGEKEKQSMKILTVYLNYTMDCGPFGVRFLFLGIKMELLLHRLITHLFCNSPLNFQCTRYRAFTNNHLLLI